MRLSRLIVRFALTLVPALAACGDSTKTDTDTLDTTPMDTQTPQDTEAPPDDSQAPQDTEVTPDDTQAPDTDDVAADGTAPDAGDASNCEYFEDPEVLKCGLGYSQVLHWKDFAHPECTSYYTKQGRRYETVQALATAENCESTCVYVATNAVDFIRCGGGGRSGYTIFKAEGETCLEQVYGTDDGIVTDLCTWATYARWCEGQ